MAPHILSVHEKWQPVKREWPLSEWTSGTATKPYLSRPEPEAPRLTLTKTFLAARDGDFVSTLPELFARMCSNR
jgi:hypothetical protein